MKAFRTKIGYPREKQAGLAIVICYLNCLQVATLCLFTNMESTVHTQILQVHISGLQGSKIIFLLIKILISLGLTNCSSVWSTTALFQLSVAKLAENIGIIDASISSAVSRAETQLSAS